MRASAVNKYMERVTVTENRRNKRLYHIGDKFLVAVSTRIPSYEVMKCYKRNGQIKEIPNTVLVIYTYFTDEKGQFKDRYNITLKPSDYKDYQIINLDYLCEATPENERKLVAECIRLAVEDGAV